MTIVMAGRDLWVVSLSRLSCLRPSDVIAVINSETVWELENFFLAYKNTCAQFR